MPRTKPAATKPTVRPRIRVLAGEEVAVGPGKAELLEHLETQASLSEAARMMGMSYMKAWLLVQVMNRSFKKPLVILERGGKKGGGARLTPAGREVVALYREMNARALEGLAPPWQKLQRLLKI